MSANVDCRIVSIGALAAHPLWGERAPVRLGHATTTLVRSEGAVILVDPALPAPALLARLRERANLGPEEVTHVFLTSFRPDGRRAIESFPDAEWLIHETERETIGAALVEQVHRAADGGDDEVAQALRADIAVLERCKPAPDRLAAHVDLFPLPGVTPGTCGLLLAQRRWTTLVCGDAIATGEHLERGMALPACADADRARESFSEAIEIADLIVPGRDNLLVNPTKRPF